MKGSEGDDVRRAALRKAPRPLSNKTLPSGISRHHCHYSHLRDVVEVCHMREERGEGQCTEPKEVLSSAGPCPVPLDTPSTRPWKNHQVIWKVHSWTPKWGWMAFLVKVLCLWASKEWRINEQFVPNTQLWLWVIPGSGQQVRTYIPENSEACFCLELTELTNSCKASQRSLDLPWVLG